MNRKYVLILMILGVAGILVSYRLPTVKAVTWVEGHITQDTTWTFADSPYVVINDVTVDTDVTLTIEPGVEVRFGGYFQLLVEGSLAAVGNITHYITFTSNKIDPLPGNWFKIIIDGGQALHLEFCLVEYSYHGIHIQNALDGFVVRNCVIRDNHYYGLCISESRYGNSHVAFNEISDCARGMTVSSNVRNLTVEHNRIFTNNLAGHGIQLAGQLGNITVAKNIIYSNAYGIYLQTSQALIKNNTIHSNMHVGLYVHSGGGPIANNSFCYNYIGIHFGVYADVSYNNIYDNTIGVDGGGHGANVEYNYWGDSSGPYHPSLNPTGTGNPVDGDRTIFDFIPFLTSPWGSINYRPTAILDVDKLSPSINETVTFDASDSTDDGRIDYYFFDFGDGTNSSWTPLSVVTHEYAEEGTYNTTLIVMDDFGITSLDSGLVYVEILVIPEFPPFLILPIFMTATLLVAILSKRMQ